MNSKIAKYSNILFNLTNKNNRYFISNMHSMSIYLKKFIFSELLAYITKSILGNKKNDSES